MPYDEFVFLTVGSSSRPSTASRLAVAGAAPSLSGYDRLLFSSFFFLTESLKRQHAHFSGEFRFPVSIGKSFACFPFIVDPHLWCLSFCRDATGV